jgi:serine/threonine protein kinase/Flp pilus assembly protein TadD
MDEESIFLEALQKPTPGDRAAYLTEACAGDGELRRDIERLLEAHERAGDFLRGDHGIATVDHAGSEGPGTIFGPYKLLEQIGEGGFGVVFMADQQRPVRRMVALKVLKPGMDTRQVVARFEAERQALALMDHSNIAHVFDGGETPSGRPYFVMELVRGIPITDFCDQNNLTVRERLGLFVNVCQAIQHAHQKGIIHRDLKPSNVLVTLHDVTPVVKVIDFGIAKATGQRLTEKTLFTNFAQLVGTPLYMSPEQAALSGLDVDTRSDIYSLGVLLYELLTGTTPFTKELFEKAGYDEIRRIIREEDPPKPSTRVSTLGQTATTYSNLQNTSPKRLSHALRGELDLIVMKCLEKDRNRRYETAYNLTRDIEHYLHDEPIQACEPSASYQFRKFAKRNKARLAVAGLILCILLLLGACFGWIARDRATRSAVLDEKVKLALEESTALQRQAKWIDALGALKRAEGILAVGGSDKVRERAQLMRNDVLMVLGLEQIRFPRGSRGAEGAVDNARADAAYALAFREYGIDVDALATSEAAQRIRARAIGKELTVSLDSWASIRKQARKPEDPSWKRLVTVSRAADADEWRNKVRQAWVQGDNKTLDALAASAETEKPPLRTLSLLGGTLAAEGSLQVLRLAQRMYPDDFWINFQLGWAFDHASPKDSGEAVRYYSVALAIRPQNVPTHMFLANALVEQGKRDEAAAVCRRGIELDPNGELAVNLISGLANISRRLGKLEDATAGYRRALDLGPDPDLTRKLYAGLGDVLRRAGKLDEAIVEFQTRLRRHQNDTELHFQLAHSLMWKNQVDAGIAEFREVIRLNKSHAPAHNDLGYALMFKGQIDEAVREFETTISVQKDSHLAYENLAWVLTTAAEPKLRKPVRAVELAKKALMLAPKEARDWCTLGVAEYRVGNWNAAKTALEKSPELPRGWFFLAMSQWQLGEIVQARESYLRAVQWMDKKKPQEEELHRFRAEAANLLGEK